MSRSCVPKAEGHGEVGLQSMEAPATCSIRQLIFPALSKKTLEPTSVKALVQLILEQRPTAKAHLQSITHNAVNYTEYAVENSFSDFNKFDQLFYDYRNGREHIPLPLKHFR